MKYIAHRGIHTNKQNENTYAAFKDIEQSNFVGFEADIRVTKDNVFVIYHDPFYKGKLVKNLYYKEMNVLTLRELLQIKTSKIVLLEIKDFNINVNKLLKLLNKSSLNIYLMSFDKRIIEKLYNTHSKYKLCILNYVINSEENYKYDFICLLNSIITSNIIDYFSKRKIKIIGYGIVNVKNIHYQNLTYIIDNDKLN